MISVHYPEPAGLLSWEVNHCSSLVKVMDPNGATTILTVRGGVWNES